ncbi:glycosyltransferase family 2 protein [Bacteroidales bacterium OttesenSCG-928-K22]|nr:glycosyltransferase family 2 protein [Bacteroidales bacterium OttesenSCG-928-K22]
MLSVIICTYNREKYIYKALKSVAEQDYANEKYELIVINNNSNDNTEKLCFEFKENYPQVNFKYYIETEQGLSYARNRGIKESSGDIIFYIDDDAEIVPGYLSEYDNFFLSHPDAIAAGGKIIPVFEGEEPKWMSEITRELLGGALDFGNTIKPFKKGKYPGGGNSAYKASAFKKFGLFNTELGRKGSGLIGSEEKDMYDRFRNEGLEFYYLPKAAILHHIPASRLTKEHFKKLSYSIGVGERIRTKAISGLKYFTRLVNEIIKWCASIILFIGYTLVLQPQKGWKLIEFRWWLTKGLMNIKLSNV